MHKTEYAFPLHLDAGNRGCEAIAIGTMNVLNICKSQYIALPKDITFDSRIDLSSKITYYAPTKNFIEYIFFRIKRKLAPKVIKKSIEYSYRYDHFLKRKCDDDIYFITGGDMLCYGDNEVIYITDFLAKQKKRIVLWGCSFGKENISVEKERIIKQYDCIIARESITYEYMTRDLGLKNVFLYPDPAFTITAEKIQLPKLFKNDCVGINLSNFVGADVNKETQFGKSIIALLKYILNNTDLSIIMLPHVFWEGQDDRKVCDYYYQLFQDDRIMLLDTENMNYAQIRYAISKCRYFIGARTHAMISAYSSCVPSIALGYSVKSRGIAKDLNMPEYSVVDFHSIVKEDDLVQRFIKLQHDEISIRKILKNEMPIYCEKAFGAKACIDDVLEGRNDKCFK